MSRHQLDPVPSPRDNGGSLTKRTPTIPTIYNNNGGSNNRSDSMTNDRERLEVSITTIRFRGGLEMNLLENNWINFLS